MADEPDVVEQFENKATVQERKADAEMRSVLADVYTFVRSSEINKTIASFTFDHYIDEAKRRLRSDRVLRSASDPAEGVGTRPSKINALEKLEQDFNSLIDKIRDVAKARDAQAQDIS